MSTRLFFPIVLSLTELTEYFFLAYSYGSVSAVCLKKVKYIFLSTKHPRACQKVIKNDRHIMTCELKVFSF